MRGPIESFWRFRLEDIEKSLEANNFEGHVVENTAAAKKVVLEEIISKDRICNTWAITEKSFPKGRVKVVLINEDLGLYTTRENL